MASPRTPAARRTGPWTYIAALLGVGVIVGAAIAVLESQGVQLPSWVAGLIALAVGGVAMLWSRGWWTRVDEGVREAHKTSWYWGGSVGMVIVGALAAILTTDRSGVALGQFAPVPGDAGLILAGILITLGLQLVGYAVFWAGWWFTRSR